MIYTLKDPKIDNTDLLNEFLPSKKWRKRSQYFSIAEISLYFIRKYCKAQEDLHKLSFEITQVSNWIYNLSFICLQDYQDTFHIKTGSLINFLS